MNLLDLRFWVFDLDGTLTVNTHDFEELRAELELPPGRGILEALAELPEDLRTALTLCEMEGLSYDEIAQVLDCPIGTVRSRIFRARRALDVKLKPFL